MNLSVRAFRRQQFAVVASFLLISSVATRAHATCGDYLAMAGTHGQSLLHAERTLDGSESDPSPASGCENGQCRSVPVSPLPETLRHLSWGRDWLPLFGFLAACHDLKCASWGYPHDCSPLTSPYLGIDTPPPRRPLLEA